MFKKSEENDFSFTKAPLTEKTALLLTFLTLVFIVIVGYLIVNALVPKPRVEITLSGPEKANAGEWVVYKVTCKNTGNVILEKPELSFQFPEEALAEKTKFESVKLGEFFFPKETKVFEFKARLFGKAGEKREVKTWLTYTRKGGKELLTSKVLFWTTTLAEIPIDLVVDIPSKIPVISNLDSDFSFRLKYNSLAEASLENLKIKVAFPKNFLLKESYPQPANKGVWEIKSLTKGESGEIEFVGIFPKRTISIGEEVEAKIQLFVQLEDKEIFLKEVASKATSFEPILSFSQKINGKESYIARSGEKLHYQISFKNITKEPLRDLKITVTLESPLFDLETIEAPLGDFTIGDNSISWTAEKVRILKYLIPGDEGEIEFWVKLKKDYKPKNLSETNAQIRNKILVAGFEKEYRNKVHTKVVVYQEGYYHDKYGFFQNSGPHPPKVNETTSYTIVWKYENYYNWIDNAKMVATFPPGVKVIGIKGNLKVEKELVPPGTYAYPGIPANFRFEKPLQEGMSSQEVRYLQIILAKEVPYAWPKDLDPTGYFGKVTVEAVNAFQLKYKDEILVPQKLQKPVGYVDELTRLKLNELLAKGVPLGGGEVVWEIGKIPPGSGIFETPPTVAFQIAFTPELIQKGQIGTLINSVVLTGTDLWTGNPIQVSDEAITTALPDDPGGIIGEGKIR